MNRNRNIMGGRKGSTFYNIVNAKIMKRILLGLVLSITVLLLNGQNYIDGTLLYHNNPEYPIPEAEAILYNEAGQQVATTITSEAGYFAFEDVADGIYTIGFSTDMEGGQVTLEDALSIVFYMAGLIDYTEIQELAMDINGSGSVNMSDFTYIMIQHLLFGRPFPAGDWVFEDVEVNTNLRSGDGSIGGSRTGDSQGVLVPTGREEVQEYEIISPNQLIVSNDEVWIPVSANLSGKSVLGFTLAMDFNPDQIEVRKVESSFGEVNYNIIDNQLRISWADTEMKSAVVGDEALVNIQVRLADSDLSQEYFTITNGTQIVDNNGVEIENLVFEMPELVFPTSSTVYPNPTTDFINLILSSEEAAWLDVKLYNANGQLVLNETMSTVKGKQTKQMNLTGQTPGVYQLIVKDIEQNIILINEKLVIK